MPQMASAPMMSLLQVWFTSSDKISPRFFAGLSFISDNQFCLFCNPQTESSFHIFPIMLPSALFLVAPLV